MAQAMAAVVLCILLTATASFEFAYALPYRWSDYYRDGALYRINQNVARFQEQVCPVNAPSLGCKTARLTVPGGSNTFVHVCPNSGKCKFDKVASVTKLQPVAIY